VARTARGGGKPRDGAPGTIEDTAEEVTARGGRGIPVRADCTLEADVAALFERVDREQRRLDVLVNAVWGANESYMEDWRRRPFWEATSTGWQEAMAAGPYGHLLASRQAARRMIAKRSGLITFVTEPVIDKYDRGGPLFWMFWSLGHRCINRMAEVMGRELRKHGVAAVALAPGFMRTERVQMHLKTEKARKAAHYDKTETTEYVGRAVAALAADPRRLRHAGRLRYVADLARSYRFKDADGRAVPNFYREMKII
jgi:NAD(P)-dependent dehydrogenase (short-subunit alcohol dehydrogenase family)